MRTSQITHQGGPQGHRPEPGANRRLTPASQLLLAGLLFALTACSTTRQVSKDSFNEPSGFLGDYSQMQKGLPDRARLYYFNPSANWTKYTKIWIKPIEL